MLLNKSKKHIFRFSMKPKVSCNGLNTLKRKLQWHLLVIFLLFLIIKVLLLTQLFYEENSLSSYRVERGYFKLVDGYACIIGNQNLYNIFLHILYIYITSLVSVNCYDFLGRWVDITNAFLLLFCARMLYATGTFWMLT